MDQRVIDLYDAYTHGGMDRREFLSRLAALVGGGAAAAAALALLQNRPAHAGLVGEEDPRLATGLVSFGPPGAPLSGYLARTRGEGKRPAVIVIHENRGLNAHIRDVTRRFALEGFLALAPDMLSPRGGTPADEDAARAMIRELDPAQVVAGLAAAAAFLAGHPESTGRVGVVGFCWGGGMANRLAAAAPPIAAAVAFGREDIRLGVRGVFMQPVDGSGEAKELLGWGGDLPSTSLSVPYPSSFSPLDGTLLFEQSTLATGSDLWLLSRDGREPAPLLATPAFEGDGAFSPDGRWIASVSDESGRQEVYVRSVQHGGRVQVSSVGGEWPIWSHDGKRLYFAQFRRVMGVDFDGQGGEPVVGRQEVVLTGFEFGRGTFDLMADGASFVVIQPAVPGSVEVRVVLGWERELPDH